MAVNTIELATFLILIRTIIYARKEISYKFSCWRTAIFIYTKILSVGNINVAVF